MAKWIDEFFGIEGRKTERGDYFDELYGLSVEEDKRARKGVMSSAWARGKRKSKDPRKVVTDLLQIQESVRNLLKIHGVPKGTTLKIATSGIGAKGCATFEDLDHFKHPRILMDKAVYDHCDSHEMLDVYSGIGLHEASHLNHTRELFHRLRDNVITGMHSTFENLFEDERIEEKVREESPGFAPYLHAAKRALFEKKELGSSLTNWEELSDPDKVNAVMFSVIRCPYLITEEMTKFITLEGTNVYEEIRKILDKLPKTERDVQRLGERAMDLWVRIMKEYRDLSDKVEEEGLDSVIGELTGEGDGSDKVGEDTGSESSESSATDCTDEKSEDTEGGSIRDYYDIEERLEKVRDSFSEDEDDEHMLKEIESKTKTLGKALDRYTGSVERIAETEKDGKVGKAKELRSELDSVVKKETEIFEDREGRRFGVLDMKRMLDRMSEITDELSMEECSELVKVTEERLEFGESSECPDSHFERRTVIVHPIVDDRAKRVYKGGYEKVRGHVARMRNVFQLRLGTRHYVQRERVEGRLDSRRIAIAPATNRIFKTGYSKTDRGIAICLLLDESGSMGSCWEGVNDDRAGIALQIAILIAESLKGLAGIELEIYSYASCGKGDNDNYMKYLYGKNQPDIRSIAGYGSGAQNYDHMAIREAGRLFKVNTENRNRLMIVLSDGAPAGSGYGGPPAIKATRDEVRKLEREMTVMQVAIASFKSEAMFKNFIRFLDLGDLINKMRRLITSIIKKTTES